MKKLKLVAGDIGVIKPIIQIIDKGKNLYLWIGDDENVGSGCFGTSVSVKSIRAFAKSILEELKKS